MMAGGSFWRRSPSFLIPSFFSDLFVNFLPAPSLSRYIRPKEKGNYVNSFRLFIHPSPIWWIILNFHFLFLFFKSFCLDAGVFNSLKTRTIMLKNGWGPADAKANRPAYSGRWLNERDRVCVCLPWLLLYTAPVMYKSNYSPQIVVRLILLLPCFVSIKTTLPALQVFWAKGRWTAEKERGTFRRHFGWV